MRLEVGLALYRASRHDAGDTGDRTRRTVCDDFLAALGEWSADLTPDGLPDAAAESGGTRAAVGFAHVLAARAAEKDGDWPAVLRHAKATVAADQQDVYAQTLFDRARALLAGQAAIDEDDLRGRFCSRPFLELEIRADGSVYTCCSAWLPLPIGHLDRDRLDRIWNSDAAREIRRSVLDGDYRHCSRLYCPEIAGGKLPRREDVGDPFLKSVIGGGTTVVDRRPHRILMSQDRSCNLSCPSCRQELIVASRDEVDRLDDMVKSQVYPFLDGVAEVKVTGSGDPFGSLHFRRLIRDLGTLRGSSLKLQIQTNGVLFDARAWTELQLEGRVSSVWVSTDAADPLTYTVVRRGGSWSRLLANFAFLGELRRQGRIGQLRLDFVVQTRNFREMPAAVELAFMLGCDGVYFQMIRNWGTFSQGEFEDLFIGSPDHPDFAEFLEVLRHPNLDRPGIDLSNIEDLRRQVLAGSVHPARTCPAGPRAVPDEGAGSGSDEQPAIVARLRDADMLVGCAGTFDTVPLPPGHAGRDRQGNDDAGRLIRDRFGATLPAGYLVLPSATPPGGPDAAALRGLDRRVADLLPEAVVLRWSGIDPATGSAVHAHLATRSPRVAVLLVARIPGCALVARGTRFETADCVGAGWNDIGSMGMKQS
ncbi:hypothetical protein N825_34060 [Skermanella stibiiresistens SB22]|uniref:4Fe4S-binding SPASM domain-containing protein n=1 Tax=Skermanella stibiiresistens SB22 TaxID=1385369 RepID=W9GQ01_9PROT|nr:hypothetical protein N825_34060 [Skermanella stibiiresistens SB22]